MSSKYKYMDLDRAKDYGASGGTRNFIECPDELKQAYKTIAECREALLSLERKLYEPHQCPSCGYVIHNLIREDK